MVARHCTTRYTIRVNTTDPTTAAPIRFEQALAEPETILRELEDGRITLEESLARYERGVGLVRQCHEQLAAAEQKIRLLAGVTEDGKIDLQPFEHSASIGKKPAKG